LAQHFSQAGNFHTNFGISVKNYDKVSNKLKLKGEGAITPAMASLFVVSRP